MRAGKILSYLSHDLAPTPDDASFVFAYQLAGTDTIYAKKSDGTYYIISGGGGGVVALPNGTVGYISVVEEVDANGKITKVKNSYLSQINNGELTAFINHVSAIINFTTQSPDGVGNFVLNSNFLRLTSKVLGETDLVGVHSYPSSDLIVGRFTDVLSYTEIVSGLGFGEYDIYAKSNNISFGNAVFADDGNGNIVLRSGAGSAVWGNISGTIEDQVDLNATFQKKPIELTYFEATNLVNNNAVVNGQLYLITDRGDLGILLVGSPLPNKFLNEGFGGFLNADYQLIGDYSLIESVTGIPLGSLVGLYRDANRPFYKTGDVAIYNNTLWQTNVDSPGVIGGSDWYEFQRTNFTDERVGYIQEWDSIIYDFQGEEILWRFDKRNNQINNGSLANFQFGNDSVSWTQKDSLSVINIINNAGQITGEQGSGSYFEAPDNNGNILNAVVERGHYTIKLAGGSVHENCRYLHSDTFDTFAENESCYDKIISEEQSTFEADYYVDVDTVTDINLTNIKHAGIVYLKTDAATFLSIHTVSDYAGFPINFKLKPLSGGMIACDWKFKDLTLVSGNIKVPYHSISSRPYDLGGVHTLTLDNAEKPISTLYGNSSSMDDELTVNINNASSTVNVVQLLNYSS